MISLCAPTFDTAGQIVSYTGAAILQSASRRSSLVPTLDQGATLVDGGWSDSDLKFQLRLPDSSGAHHLAIVRLMRYHSTAVLSCSRGCYNALLSGLTYDRGTTVVTAEVKEALS